METGDLTDEQTRERMRRFLNALVQWVERFEEPTTAYERSTRQSSALIVELLGGNYFYHLDPDRPKALEGSHTSRRSSSITA